MVMMLASAVGMAVVINIIFFPLLTAVGVKYFDFANGKYMVGTLMIILPMVAGGMVSKMKIKKIPIYQYVIEGIKYLSKPKNQSLRGEKSNNTDLKMTFGIDDPI